MARYAGAYPGRFVMVAGMAQDGVEEADYGKRLRQAVRDDVAAGAVALGELTDKGRGLVRVGERAYFIDDPRFDPLWDEAGRLEASRSSSTSASPPPSTTPRTERTSCAARGTGRSTARGRRASPSSSRSSSACSPGIPQTHFVAVHAFNLANDLGQVGRLLDRHPNVDVDFAARIWELARQPFSARRFFDEYPDRIVFGTDNDPDLACTLAHARQLETEDEWFWSADAEWWRSYGMNLPEEVLAKVYRTNAERLLASKR